MEIIDLKKRETFGDEGRGIAAIVDDPDFKIRQICLEPGREIPAHRADALVTMQVMRGEAVFSSGGEGLRMGPGKLLRIPEGAEIGVSNESAQPVVFLVIKAHRETDQRENSALLTGTPGTFVNMIDFAPSKPGKEEAFREWFHHSSMVFARHPGFISRTLLGPIDGGGRYAAVVEHESKETFMDMQLSDDREEFFRQVEPLVLGSSTPHFYETLLSYRK